MSCNEQWHQVLHYIVQAALMLLHACLGALLWTQMAGLATWRLGRPPRHGPVVHCTPTVQ